MKTYMVSSCDSVGITRASGSNGSYDINNLMTGLGQMITRAGVACHATKLWVYCSQTGNGSTIELYKNGVGTGLKITTTGGAGVYSATGSVACAASDSLGFHLVAAGGSDTTIRGVGVILEAD